MKIVYLTTRLMKAWSATAALPATFAKGYKLETTSNKSYKLTKVEPAPTLGSVAASPAVATVSTAYNGAVAGRTVGSTLALTGAGAAGLAINSTTGAITGTPTTAGPVNVVETLAGATGSPKTTAAVITVSA